MKKATDLSRRSFIKGTAAGLGGAICLAGCGAMDSGQDGSAALGKGGAKGGKGAPAPVILISLDSLHPAYLELNRRGFAGGKPGDWLMPNVQAFLSRGTNFVHSRTALPSATDPNHLNVVSGTDSSQTGIIGVAAQPYQWKANGEADVLEPHLAWARDDQGRRVRTLFQLWQDAHPQSGTAFISGKGWVAEMYRYSKKHHFDPGLTTVVSGDTHPDYVPDVWSYNFYDPPTDKDAACDPESAVQKAFIKGVYLKDQDALEHFPSDRWVTEATLRVLKNEQPGLSLVLLAQVDDTHHAMGAAWDLSEFVKRDKPYTPPKGCQDPGDPNWQLVSKRNAHVLRAPILDAVRDADVQFGRLMAGIRALPAYRDATVVLYSDHSHVTHLLQKDYSPKDHWGKDTDPVRILRHRGLLSRKEADQVGFSALTGSSLGVLYWHPNKPNRAKAIAASKQALLAHRAKNPATGKWECPWDVLDHADVKAGVPGVAAPGELWHDYFGPGGKRPIWPDLCLFARNGWQLVVYAGLLGNLGVDLPEKTPPLTPMLGGHGAPDTQPIVMAMQGPGVAKGRRLLDPGYKRDFRIGDLGVTLAARCGLTFPHTTVGRDRSKLIKG